MAEHPPADFIPEPAPMHLMLTTFPDEPTAHRIVKTLVEERVVACGNVLPGITSIYHWRGSIETAAETMVLFKTSASPETAMDRLKELHPYEVPEIVLLPVSVVNSSYLAWLVENCRA